MNMEGLMLKLKLENFGHLMRRTDSSEKTLMLGKIEGRRRRGRRRMRWLDSIATSMDMSWVNSRSWCWTGRPGVLQFMGSQWVRHNWETELNGANGGVGSMESHQGERGRDQLFLPSNVITSNQRKRNPNRTKQRPNTIGHCHSGN